MYLLQLKLGSVRKAVLKIASWLNHCGREKKGISKHMSGVKNNSKYYLDECIKKWIFSEQKSEFLLNE